MKSVDRRITMNAKYSERDKSFEDVYNRPIPPKLDPVALGELVAIRDMEIAFNEVMNSDSIKQLIKEHEAHNERK